MDKDAPSPDNDDFYDGGPPWMRVFLSHTEADFPPSVELHEFCAMMAGAPVLPAEECSAIAETLKMDESKFARIILAVYDGLMRRKIAHLATPGLRQAFSSLHDISRKLTEVAEELNGASRHVRRLLNVAYSSRGERGMKCRVQKMIEPLMPNEREWIMAHVDERFERISENYALAMIQCVLHPMRMLLELKPRKRRGSPGRSLRNAIIRELAEAYEEVVGEIPTSTPTGRFMLLCQLTLDALGVDNAGLESAVQRTLHDLKEANLHPHK